MRKLILALLLASFWISPLQAETVNAENGIQFLLKIASSDDTQRILQTGSAGPLEYRLYATRRASGIFVDPKYIEIRRSSGASDIYQFDAKTLKLTKAVGIEKISDGYSFLHSRMVFTFICSLGGEHCLPSDNLGVPDNSKPHIKLPE
jgi:hypothetical protein